MNLFFKITSVIASLFVLTSCLVYFFTFDKLSDSNLCLLRGLIFLSISGMLITYQYEFRHNLLSENKKNMSKAIMIGCILLAVVFVVLSIIQFCNI